MIDATVAMIRRWATQDVARTNAAQASARLRLRRLQLEEVDEYVARLAADRAEERLGGSRPTAWPMSDGHVDER
jgi:hypothetical protein